MSTLPPLHPTEKGPHCPLDPGTIIGETSLKPCFSLSADSQRIRKSRDLSKGFIWFCQQGLVAAEDQAEVTLTLRHQLQAGSASCPDSSSK